MRNSHVVVLGDRAIHGLAGRLAHHRWWRTAPGRLELLVVAVIASGAAAGAMSAFQSHVIGHDEGIYAVTAAAIRADWDYRLTNLPSQPLQTKYPPLYPLVLASVMRSDVPLAAQIIRLKSVNAVCLALTLVLTALVIHRAGVAGWWPVSSTLLLLAISPGLMSSTNWLMADPLFTMLIVAVLVATPLSPAEARPSRVVGAAVLAGLAGLTRSVGIAACIGVAWCLVRRVGLRPAVIAAVVMLSIVGPWWVWTSADHHTSLNVLESYYVTYERSAWGRLVEQPSFALRMLGWNAVGLVSIAPTVAGFYTPVTAVIAGIVMCVGLFQTWRVSLTQLMIVSGVAYLLIVIGHPMNLDRYVIPLMPGAFVMLAVGLARLTRGTSLRARTWAVPVTVAIAMLIGANALWLRHYLHVARLGKSAGIGQVQPFDWKGFEEVIAWVRANTPPAAIIASGYDTTYAVYTGRRGLRPWLHEPETYDPRYGRYLHWSSDTRATARLLTQADVSYLIVDPFPADGAGLHARMMLQSLIRESPRRWELRFASSDGRHQIYRRTDAPDEPAQPSGLEAAR